MITQKITVKDVLSEGIGLGIKNSASLLVASILWLITSWIPYINVGTTIAMGTIPIELSKGKVISPTFIFDSKYRRYMGEFFTLIGLMWMAISPALLFGIIPGIIIYLGWSLSLFILLDKGIAPGEAMVQSNKATYGYKGTIFVIDLIINIAAGILFLIFLSIPYLGIILDIVLIIAFIVIKLGCSAVIYRNLTAEETKAISEV